MKIRRLVAVVAIGCALTGAVAVVAAQSSSASATSTQGSRWG